MGVAAVSLSLTFQRCHPLQEGELSLCLQYLLTWVVTLLGFLGMVLTELRELLAGRKKGAPPPSPDGRNAELCPSAASLWHSSVWFKVWCQLLREKLLLLNHCALRAVAPFPRKKGRILHLHREGARHLHLWNSSRGELTDVNLLQMPNLLLALD